jgi:hypothetical protein
MWTKQLEAKFDTKPTKAIINPLRFTLFELGVCSVENDY